MTLNLGSLEVRVLGLLDTERPQSVTDIQERLDREGTVLAYTTVMTVLSRLHEKGLADREKNGRRFDYRAGSRTPVAKSGLLGRLGQALFRREKLKPILSLVDSSELSDSELKELRVLLDKRLKGGNPR